MKEDIGLILFNTISYHLDKVVAEALIEVKHRHEKKLVNLRQHKRKLMTKVILCFFVALCMIIHCTNSQ